MKRLLPSLLVLTLALEAAGTGGGVLFCRILGQRLTSCCCPDSQERLATSVIAAASCCDVLEGAAPASPESLPRRMVVSAPESSPRTMDVEPPPAPVDLVGDTQVTAWVGPSGPPRRIPVFLALRQLLI